MHSNVHRAIGVSCTLALVATFVVVRKAFRRDRKRGKRRQRHRNASRAEAEPDEFFRLRYDAARTPLVTHSGACHCQRVQFVVEAPARVVAVDCTCSVCTKKGRFPHLVVPTENVHMKFGHEQLSVYQHGARNGEHFFCATCGTHLFNYAEPAAPGALELVEVNVHALDPASIASLDVSFFAGSHLGDVGAQRRRQQQQHQLRRVPQLPVAARAMAAVSAAAKAAKRNLLDDLNDAEVSSIGGARPRVPPGPGPRSPEYVDTLAAWAALGPGPAGEGGVESDSEADAPLVAAAAAAAAHQQQQQQQQPPPPRAAANFRRSDFPGSAGGGSPAVVADRRRDAALTTPLKETMERYLGGYVERAAPREGFVHA